MKTNDLLGINFTTMFLKIPSYVELVYFFYTFENGELSSNTEELIHENSTPRWTKGVKYN